MCLPKNDMGHDFDNFAGAHRSRSPWRGRRRPPLKNPKPTGATAGAGDYDGQTMNTEISHYRRRGKPERAMAEIRRMLLRKIFARLEKERETADLLKESTQPERISIGGSDF